MWACLPDRVVKSRKRSDDLATSFFASLVRALPLIVVLIAAQNLLGNAYVSSVAGVPADHVAAVLPTDQVCSSAR
jgi:hypothetical protein